jgi:2-hydroxycyclohexanecarboxyl-CoA dehydrogenase
LTDSRVAVVTGAGRGIGEAVALRLAKDGLAVAVWDRNAPAAAMVAEELINAGHQAHAFVVDVTDTTSVQRATQDVVDTWGHVDVLVNNAGGGPLSMFLETSREDWLPTIELNFVAVLLTCRYLVPRVCMSAHGRIINIASDTAKIGSPLEAVYSGAKAGVVAFSRALARAIAETGTTVNVVCPGAIDTPLLRELTQAFEHDPRFGQFWPEGPITSSIKATPLKTLGNPRDVAHAVAFFAQPDSAFITGQVLSVDGGLTMS